jgi:hypothetical protein
VVQLPLYTANDMAVAAGTMLDRLTRWAAPVAVNLNHTSSSIPVVLQVGAGKLLEGVALDVVPAVVAAQLKSGFTMGMFVAPVHSSFGGGGGVVPTQILKVAVAVVVTLVNTRTRYTCVGIKPPTSSVLPAIHPTCVRAVHNPLYTAITIAVLPPATFNKLIR